VPRRHNRSAFIVAITDQRQNWVGHLMHPSSLWLAICRC
jgi:hypothetical protein